MRRTSFLLLLAIIAGVAASWFAYQRVNRPTAAMAQDNTTGVVVAAFDIPLGSTIDAPKIRLAPWPKDSVPEGAFTTVESAIGKLASVDVIKGEPLTSRRIVDNLGGSALANLIEPNKRAMTVRVNDVIGVGGFLLPGNRVDVLATRTTRGSGGERAETRTLLTNLKVLAVDQQARTEEDQPVVVRAVTVEVDPKEAEQLTAATQEGTVQLVLRNPLDTDVPAVVEAAPAPKPVVRRTAAKKPEAPAADPNTASVTVIRGTASDTSKAQK